MKEASIQKYNVRRKYSIKSRKKTHILNKMKSKKKIYFNVNTKEEKYNKSFEMKSLILNFFQLSSKILVAQRILIQNRKGKDIKLLFSLFLWLDIFSRSLTLKLLSKKFFLKSRLKNTFFRLIGYGNDINTCNVFFHHVF